MPAEIFGKRIGKSKRAIPENKIKIVIERTKIKFKELKKDISSFDFDSERVEKAMNENNKQLIASAIGRNAADVRARFYNTSKQIALMQKQVNSLVARVRMLYKTSGLFGDKELQSEIRNTALDLGLQRSAIDSFILNVEKAREELKNSYGIIID